MPKSTRPRGDDVPICTQTVQGHYCGQRHMDAFGLQSCAGHVIYDRDSYVKGQDRKKLDQPRPCRRVAVKGADVCIKHGGDAAQVKAAGERREAEQKAENAVMRLLGDAGEPVVDPIGKLCAIAGRAVKFMEALGDEIDKLEKIDSDTARAMITIYARSIKDAAGVVESIIRMGIAERLTKASEQETAALVSFIDGVLSDLGHNPRDPQVAGIVARRLELVS